LQHQSPIGSPALNPIQHANEQDQADQVKAEDAANRDGFLPEGGHIEYPERDQEEGQVANQEDQPGGAGIPPGIVPGEGTRSIQEQLDDHAKNRPNYGENQAIRDSKNLETLIGWQHFGESDPSNGEHEANFDVQANQD